MLTSCKSNHRHRRVMLIVPGIKTLKLRINPLPVFRLPSMKSRDATSTPGIIRKGTTVQTHRAPIGLFKEPIEFPTYRPVGIDRTHRTKPRCKLFKVSQGRRKRNDKRRDIIIRTDLIINTSIRSIHLKVGYILVSTTRIQITPYRR
jgi:hypothetical protein